MRCVVGGQMTIEAGQLSMGAKGSIDVVVLTAVYPPTHNQHCVGSICFIDTLR